MAIRAPRENSQNSRPGVVMLLALILLAAVTASTVGLSLVISQTLRQSRNLDNFIVASLAADSGIERGLAVIYQGRLNNIWFDRTIGAVPYTEQEFANAASYRVTQDYSTAPLVIPKLKSGSTFSFDLLRPTSDDDPESEEDDPANRVVIKAECVLSSDKTCSALLEVNWVFIDQYGESTQSNRMVLSGIETNALPYVSGVNIDLTTMLYDEGDGPDFTGNYFGYRLNLRALNGDIRNIAITPCGTPDLDPTSGDCPTEEIKKIIGRITINSTGEVTSGGTTVQSNKTAAVLWQPPASEMLNYVLFTESDIIP